MKKEPIYVAFSTQKGGAGKTTLTALIASYLHYERDYNVAIIDCDFPQLSIYNMRERDLAMALEDEFYRGMAYEQFTRLNGKKAYPVVRSNTDNAIADAEKTVEESERGFDIIFFDLPGTMNNRGLIHTLAHMDYIIAPIAASRVVMESTLDYLITVRDNIVASGKSNIKAMYLLWNLVDGREKSELYEVYEGVIRELEFPLLRTFLPNSVRFRREQNIDHKALFLSTLFPPDKSLLKGSNIDTLTEELLELLTGNRHE
ncbi:cellulose biosynthesis protein BcsQ [Dysgonomonas hofstadii]|uniref:Cellulose biosynthesis protein BcsQ n=1 Tax=Dysgonomonas hofstadii TaxID=637886 RepID=A0A840CUE1_9BACT|nr:ParA family protein [Dysgonomonas hofstadii]MBB4038299.1 cellulose biosynthesis protein BcsQ [Dysgonomonas hofstadii]